jgi:hypothetical protein
VKLFQRRRECPHFVLVLAKPITMSLKGVGVFGFHEPLGFGAQYGLLVLESFSLAA